MSENNNIPPQSNPPQQQYQQPVYQQPVYVPLSPQQQSVRNMAVAGMVFGIVALALNWFFFLSIPCGIVGLILSIISIKKGQKGMAVAGLVCSILALFFALFIVIFIFTTFSFMSNQFFDIINT